MNNQIIWQSDFYECLFTADEIENGWRVQILFDEFPFESPLEAQTFLQVSGLHGTIDYVGNKFTFVLPIKEEMLYEIVPRIAHRLVWRQ